MIHLSPGCLHSKHGFNDGDPPEEFLDWLDETGRYDEVAPLLGHGPDIWQQDGWRAALVLLVRERLLPVLDPPVEVHENLSNHNPIRAADPDPSLRYGWEHGVDVSFEDCLDAVRRSASQAAR